MEAARVYLADDLDFQGSIDTFHRADDFIVALTMFQKMLSRVDLFIASILTAEPLCSMTATR